MNPMQYKTPEERKQIAAKGAATRAARRKAQEDERVNINSLKVEIKELTRRRNELAAGISIATAAKGLCGQYLLTEDQIVAGATATNRCSGVYFLVKNNRVVYVGQSINVFSRPHQHKDKEFDAIAYVLCDVSALDRLESLYIHTLNPPLNGSCGERKSAPLRLDELLPSGIDNAN